MRIGQSGGRSKHASPKITTRRKSCQNCCDAKTRCSLERPCCSRCHSRGLDCHYLTSDPSSVPTTIPASVCDPSETENSSLYAAPASIESPSTAESIRIGSRWLDALIPPTGHTPKNLTVPTVHYMSRVLKSYPKITARKEPQLPPIIHPRQSAVPQPPLANCRSLLRMWEAKAPGSESMVRETVGREMSRLFVEVMFVRGHRAAV
jgi:hypothetical protein